MKESFWSILIITLGITSIAFIYFFQNVTSQDEQNYALLKEVTEAAMYDAVDLGEYRATGNVRINREKFVENFLRRFAESVTLGNTYVVEIYDVNEIPPKVSLKVKSALNSNIMNTDTVEFSIENADEITVLADCDKLIAVIINLVKNASEAFPINEEDGAETAEKSKAENKITPGKYIKIKTEKEEDFAQIQISNNAKGIENPEKIFNEGYTTKSTGSGLGLWICKKSIEEQLGQLELTRTSEDYTEFTISLGLVE